MSVGGLFAGTHTILVGVEDQDDGGLRLYLNHRSQGLALDPKPLRASNPTQGEEG